MWLPTVEQVIRIHDDVLEFSGGEQGVLNRGAIEAAIERARWGPFPGPADLPGRAALLLRGIIQDHPFVDGNKRTAYEAADTFLEHNGLVIVADDEEVVDMVVSVAKGHPSLEGIRAWIRARVRNA